MSPSAGDILLNVLPFPSPSERSLWEFVLRVRQCTCRELPSVQKEAQLVSTTWWLHLKGMLSECDKSCLPWAYCWASPHLSLVIFLHITLAFVSQYSVFTCSFCLEPFLSFPLQLHAWPLRLCVAGSRTTNEIGQMWARRVKGKWTAKITAPRAGIL